MKYSLFSLTCEISTLLFSNVIVKVKSSLYCHDEYYCDIKILIFLFNYSTYILNCNKRRDFNWHAWQHGGFRSKGSLWFCGSRSGKRILQKKTCAKILPFVVTAPHMSVRGDNTTPICNDGVAWLGPMVWSRVEV